MTISRRVRIAAASVGISSLAYAAATLGQFHFSMGVGLFLALASIAAALISWLVLLVSCLSKRLANPWEALLLFVTAALAIGVVLLTPAIQSIGARLFLTTHADDLAELANGLIADYGLHSQSGPWLVEARTATATSERSAAPRAIKELGFVLAEVTPRYAAFANYGFQGTYTGFLYDKSEESTLAAGDSLFSNEIVVLKRLSGVWYLFATR